MWEAEVGFADCYTEAIVRKRVSKRISFEAGFLIPHFQISSILNQLKQMNRTVRINRK